MKREAVVFLIVVIVFGISGALLFQDIYGVYIAAIALTFLLTKRWWLQ